MSFKWRMQAISNDGKRMYKEVVEEFFPYLGLALRGYVGSHEMKVSNVVWDGSVRLARISTVIMSEVLPDSKEFEELGWQVIAPIQ